MAAVVVRRPLSTRVQQGQIPNVVPTLSTKAHGSTSASKRARSPDMRPPQAPAGEAQASKRVKCSTGMTTISREHDARERERKRALKEAAKEDFRAKYTKAFPSWVFYFDTNESEAEELAGRVKQLNARVAQFFSNEVTHLITNKPVPPQDPAANKENETKINNLAALKSPIKLRGFDQLPNALCDSLVKKALQLQMKIWNTTKLSSVLTRCSIPAPSAKATSQSRSLSTLLEKEKRHGATSERDPTQKRHDYRYFSKNSYFVLVEDIRQEFATIAAHEYPITRTKDGQEKGDWPIPYCHPFSRGPFIEYNEREERRREKQERLDREREAEQSKEIKRIKLLQRRQARRDDLRRTVSMSNLCRQVMENDTNVQGCDDDGADVLNIGPSTVAPSGYLGSTATSGYIAASGNSVGITSTYGTTSTMGLGSSLTGASTLPAPLRGRLQSQVVTSRRVSALDRVRDQDTKVPGRSVSLEASASSVMMPPPPGLPDRMKLKRSKSTNTIKLPKRDEKSKPGYCESCRAKFEDFKQHVRGRKHQKFALNESNYVQLDGLLERVRRMTAEEGRQAEEDLAAVRKSQMGQESTAHEDTTMNETEVIYDSDNDIDELDVMHS